MRKTIAARNGYILTDGENFCTIIDLADGSTASDWYEITEVEYQEIWKEREQVQAEANAELGL